MQATSPPPDELTRLPLEGLPDAQRSRRVLQVSFACHPELSMETRIGWQRAVHAASRHEVVVLHGNAANQGLLTTRAKEIGLADRLRFQAVRNGPLAQTLMRSAGTYYAGYRLWQRQAWRVAMDLNRQTPFDLVHQVTYCGFREPGYCWRLGVPFVWGPVGGTQSYPLSYLTQLDPWSAWVELCRNAINWWQLRFSRRVRCATRRATVLMAATHKAADDLAKTHGRLAPVRLETGIDHAARPARSPRRSNSQFRILWSGRLRAWKTLPLLLRALPLLPPDLDWRLRVLGVGSSERNWRALADRLGVADRIEWLGWPDYRETLPHYRWADAFAFTSMRDTSGTGLLEALAAGTPIVGVNHQGAADIMTTDCAMPVPVDRPRDTISGFATALTTLARDPSLWACLSDGAQRRAAEFAWDLQADPLLEWYETACDGATAGKGVVSPQPTPYRPPRRAAPHATVNA